ncbi:MAG TPA: glycosyltransferase family 39 protein [Acidimicrobiales bacterium]|nr:glycosyltransferase family 39 protein [Acidimicrobiales bacterium]
MGDGPSAKAAEPTRPRRVLHFWSSPPDQPCWARPALLVVAALAALSYAWGIADVALESFYAASVRSMAENWHNFFFGAFDPWGTVTVDKLPGAFWIQALSLRVFGFHLWAIALPQVVEGTLTVLVLYRAVRRVAGPGAGLAAAIVLAASPATILLNRGNVSDSLLILLLVLAADAATAAITTGRLWALLLAGVWVGLAFQAKMLQAWIVLPALFGPYVLAAPATSLYRRCGHVLLSALAALAVSLSYMSVVALVPAQDRPYVDGSCDNSLFSQVFLYNAADRVSGQVLDQPGCLPAAPAAPGGATPNTVAVARGPARFLSGPFGRDAAWLLVPTAAALTGILAVRRRRPRTDPLRAAALLWAATLFLTWSVFASSNFLNSYYLAALIPAMAALCGMGLATSWRMRQPSRMSRVAMMATVAIGTAYAVVLVPDDAGVRPWVIATTVVAAVSALVLLGLSLRGRPVAARTLPAGLGLSALALILGPIWASSTVVVAGLGPFDTPYQSAALTAVIHAENEKALALWPAVIHDAAHFPPTESVSTGQSSSAVSRDTLATGREYLPVGGFTGRVPTPSLAQFVYDVAHHRIVRVVVAVKPPSQSPDLRWVVAHCRRQAASSGTTVVGRTGYRRYLCTPGDATG